LFVKKHYQPFRVRTGGDALMKLPCSGLLLSIEVCCLRTWKRGESFLFILKNHTRCRRVQRWATSTLAIASLPLFVKFNSGAIAPITEQK